MFHVGFPFHPSASITCKGATKRCQGWAPVYPCCFPGLKVQTASLILRLSNIHYRLWESVLSGLWLRWHLARRCKKYWKNADSVLASSLCPFLRIHFRSLLERGHCPVQTNNKKSPHMFKPYLLLAQSSNSSIINLLLGATNTPGSLVCKYLAKTAVMKLTASVSGWLGIPREAAYVQNHSRWKRNQQKSTATVNVCTKDIIDPQNESCLNRHWKIGEKSSSTWKGLIGWD